ncbi:hypothetical protein TNCV_3680321 [Trichonephila clavipes]|nr:hypothetical protein TNCV_3680321 [Trichonephila clavipes]
MQAGTSGNITGLKSKMQQCVWTLYRLREVINASHVVEIVNGFYGADTVTASYVQFWSLRFRSGIFDVKDAPRTSRPVVENVDKIT